MSAIYIFLILVTLVLDNKQLVSAAGEEVDCHAQLGVSRDLAVGLYSSEGLTDRGRLHATDSWTSNRSLLVADRDAAEDAHADYAWLQVDLVDELLVSGIQTQGNPGQPEWVTSFSVLHSRDCEHFTPLQDGDGDLLQFDGNYDSNTTVTTTFHEIMVARCIRVVPRSYHGNQTALRVELLGCDVTICQEALLTHLKGKDLKLRQKFGHKITTSMLQGKKKRRRVMQTFSNHVRYTREHQKRPTLVTRGYAEFVFDAEKLLFGMVLYRDHRTRASSFILTYSRNCFSWTPIKQRRGYGDPLVFRSSYGKYSLSWLPFPYPVRASCVRVVPLSHLLRTRDALRAQFIGCGTGPSVTTGCGLRKRVRVRRVVGGVPAEAGWWPWLVSLDYKPPGEENSPICGASLIHEQWVLTAGHCVHVLYALSTGNYSDRAADWNLPGFLSTVRVRIADHSKSLLEGTQMDSRVSVIVPHPGLNASYYVNDIALLKLERPVTLTDHMTTICISEDPFPAGSYCEVIGWGRTSTGFPQRPHHAGVPLVSKEDCQIMYDNINLTPDMLCAAPEDGKQDACVGDSGGPLVCEKNNRWYQVGIVSWNIGCGRPGYPGVYANVTHFRNWITNVTTDASYL